MLYCYIDKYLPFGFLVFSVLTGGDLVGDIIGIIGGHIYYYLKDVVPITFRRDFLKTPKFMMRFDYIGQPETVNNNVFNNRNQANQANQGPNQNNNGGRGSFQAFSGRGTSFN